MNVRRLGRMEVVTWAAGVKLRRLRQQWRLRQMLFHTLYRARLFRWKNLARTVCLWWFCEWRGWDLDEDTVRDFTEVDFAVAGLLRWANSEYALKRTIPVYIEQSVSW